MDAGAFHYVLLLDIIEHLRSPEQFIDSLRKSRRQAEDTTVIVSTGNIGFLVTRLMLLLGHFHYGARGILDLTHTRLFTFATLRNAFEQAGYQIIETRGVPAPVPSRAGRQPPGSNSAHRQSLAHSCGAAAILLSDFHGGPPEPIFGVAPGASRRSRQVARGSEASRIPKRLRSRAAPPPADRPHAIATSGFVLRSVNR